MTYCNVVQHWPKSETTAKAKKLTFLALSCPSIYWFTNLPNVMPNFFQSVSYWQHSVTQSNMTVGWNAPEMNIKLWVVLSPSALCSAVVVPLFTQQNSGDESEIYFHQIYSSFNLYIMQIDCDKLWVWGFYAVTSNQPCRSSALFVAAQDVSSSPTIKGPHKWCSCMFLYGEIPRSGLQWRPYSEGLDRFHLHELQGGFTQGGLEECLYFKIQPILLRVDIQRF